ncbi:MAG TPA: CRISPR-associated endoribonuclease Cas6 [Thermoclostridium sp.]
MHISIEMIGQKDIILPIHYNHIIQGFIYNMIDKELSDFLHNKGYGDSRKFKLFCFSNIIGKAHIDEEKNNMVFKSPIKLVISSPDEYFCESFANTILKKDINLGANTLEIGRIEINRQRVLEDKIELQALSPITAYSTLLRPDGRKYTCFFQPGEEDFNRIVEENLRKKYYAFTGTEPPKDKVYFKLLTKPKLHIIKYKDFIIKGYTCKLIVEGPRQLLQMAVDAGLGSKNSQGFGCVEIMS